MRVGRTLIFLFLLAGCAPGNQASMHDAKKAREALIHLMRSDSKLFRGADVQRFESVAIERSGDSKYTWGAFTIDTQGNAYRAVVDMGDTVWFYNGKFSIDPNGQMVAMPPQVSHAQKHFRAVPE